MPGRADLSAFAATRASEVRREPACWRRSCWRAARRFRAGRRLPEAASASRATRRAPTRSATAWRRTATSPSSGAIWARLRGVPDGPGRHLPQEGEDAMVRGRRVQVPVDPPGRRRPISRVDRLYFAKPFAYPLRRRRSSGCSVQAASLCCTRCCCRSSLLAAYWFLRARSELTPALAYAAVSSSRRRRPSTSCGSRRNLQSVAGRARPVLCLYRMVSPGLRSRRRWSRFLRGAGGPCSARRSSASPLSRSRRTPRWLCRCCGAAAPRLADDRAIRWRSLRMRRLFSAEPRGQRRVNYQGGDRAMFYEAKGFRS